MVDRTVSECGMVGTRRMKETRLSDPARVTR